MEINIKVILPDTVVEQARKVGLTEEQLRKMLNARIISACTKFLGEIALRYVEKSRTSSPIFGIEISYPNNQQR